MKDPIPWQDTTELERQLLEAARRDVAPPALRAKMAQALSSLPPPAAGASVSTAVTRARLLFSHPALWGSLCAVIVAAAVRWQSSSHAKPANALAQQSTPLPVAPIAAAPTQAMAELPPAAAATPPAPGEAPPSAAAPAHPALEPSNLAAAPLSTARATAGRAAVLPRATLREELALLDSARSALAAHDTALAFQLLDKHANRFARAHLTPEAEALRIDAWAQRGEMERVERLSRRFLERHPAHPLAAHVADIARLH